MQYQYSLATALHSMHMGWAMVIRIDGNPYRADMINTGHCHILSIIGMFFQCCRSVLPKPLDGPAPVKACAASIGGADRGVSGQTAIFDEFLEAAPSPAHRHPLAGISADPVRSGPKYGGCSLAGRHRPPLKEDAEDATVLYNSWHQILSVVNHIDGALVNLFEGHPAV